MPVFYIDTSAFVKRYRTESGTEVIDKLFDSLGESDRLATSVFGILEFVTTCRRLLKGQEINDQDFADMIAHFVNDLNSSFVLHPVDDDILAEAVDVVMQHALRTADAIHLAAALSIQSFIGQSDEDFVFVADDEELCEAAADANLTVINPRASDSAEQINAYLSYSDEDGRS